MLTQVLGINATCSWDSTPQADCAIRCSSLYSFSGSETTAEVLAQLEEKWKEVIFFISLDPCDLQCRVDSSLKS